MANISENVTRTRSNSYTRAVDAIAMSAMSDPDAFEREHSEADSKHGKKISARTFIAANWFSRFCFWWLNDAIIHARSGKLREEHLQLPDAEEANRCYNTLKTNWQAELQKAKTKNRQPSLFRALVRSFWGDFIVGALFKIVWGTMVIFCSYYFVIELVNVVRETHSAAGLTPSRSDRAWGLCVGYFVSCLGLSMALQQMVSRSVRVGLRMRAALISAVFRKALLAEGTSANVGEVVTLISSDCARIHTAASSMQYLWSGPLEAITMVCLIFQQIGYVAFIGVIIMAITLPTLYAISVNMTSNRYKGMMATESRTQIIHEVLHAVKLVKYYSWEVSFAKAVRAIRVMEMKMIRRNAFLKSVHLMIVFSVPVMLVLTQFTAYTLWLNLFLTAAQAFALLSTFNTLRFSLVVLPVALKNVVDARLGLARIAEFLQRAELLSIEQGTGKKGMSCKGCVFGYRDRENTSRVNPALRDITFDLPAGKLMAVCGGVSAGKSTLLNGLIGQAVIVEGMPNIVGNIAYLPQEPWIQHATVRDNILFGSPFDEERYRKVLFACALEADMKILEFGDLTEIGEAGINLSGGQRQRVALARATYANADNYLLDTPLSAVDHQTCNHIFEHCIKGLLKDKAVILLTHNLHLLPEVDQIMICEDSKVAFVGPFHPNMMKTYFPEVADAVQSKSAGEGEARHEHLKSVRSGSLMLPAARALAMDLSPQRLDEEDESGSDPDQTQAHLMAHNYLEGTVDPKTILQDSHAGTEMTLLPARNATVASVTPLVSTHHTGTKSKKHRTNKKSSSDSKLDFNPIITWSGHGGHPFMLWGLLIIAGTQVIRIVSDLYVRTWSANNTTWAADGFPHRSDQVTSVLTYMGFFLGFTGALLVRGISFFGATIRSATAMHNKMFRSVMKAPLMFFTMTPMGPLLDSFSRQQDQLDETMPDAFMMALIYLAILLTSVGVIVSVLPWFALVLGMLIVFTVLLQMYYGPAAGHFKRAVAETNPLIFAHVSETMHGVAVVRAFHAERRFEEQNVALINKNHTMLFYGEHLQTWLAFRMDAMSSLAVFATALLVVAFRASMSASDAGLAISNSLQMLVFFTMMIRDFNEGFSQVSAVVSIEKLIRHTPHEKSEVTVELGDGVWPQRGEVKFKAASMRYFPNAEPVLRNVTLDIKAGDKIGIVGRTGAGKSSLLIALFRLVELHEGSILIDGVDVSKLALHDLRISMAIIPQEPVMFKGTIRSNMDPFHEYDDSALWEALRLSHLYEVVSAFPHKLDSIVAQNGSNISLGHKQLFCLARAVLRRSKILVLDEATSALDLKTDALIQQTVRTVFKESTVLTIAHRLETILDYDKILFMQNGEVLEFDDRAKLMANPNSHFSALLRG